MPKGSGDWVQKVREWKINELLRDPPPVITVLIRGGVLLALFGVIIYALKQISGSGSNEPGDLFQVFFLLVVLGGSVGAVAYWLMKRDLYASADRHVNRQVRDLRENLDKFTKEKVTYSTVLAEAKSLQGMSFTFFESYEIALQEILKGEDASKFPSERHEVVLAKALVGHALSCFEDPPLVHAINKAERSFSQLSKDDEYAYRHYTNLVNHSIYHAMAQCIFKAGVSDSREGTPIIGEDDSGASQGYGDITRKAYMCVRLLDDPRLAEQVYELQDTVGTCLALSPNPPDREKGKQLLKDVITGHSPTWGDPASSCWRIQRWEEHNPRFKLDVTCPT